MITRLYVFYRPVTRLLQCVSLATAVLVLPACNAPEENPEQATNPSAHTQDISTQANALFEIFFNENVARSPMMQTRLGIKTDYGKWDDISETAAQQRQALRRSQLQRLLVLDPSQMNAATALSYHLQKQQLEQGIEGYRWRYHNYPVNQMSGFHTAVPSLLINQHQVSNEADAIAYILRLKGIPELFNQLIDGLKIRADKGVIAPSFIFPYVLRDSRNLITGEPAD